VAIPADERGRVVQLIPAADLYVTCHCEERSDVAIPAQEQGSVGQTIPALGMVEPQTQTLASTHRMIDR
jgi:hypothetical protein